MISLYAYGVLDKAHTLPRALTVKSLMTLPIYSKASRTFAYDNLNLLKTMNERNRLLEFALRVGIVLGAPIGWVRNAIITLLSRFFPELDKKLRAYRKKSKAIRQ
jgi:hypothetical protein